jgi:cytochrome P450
MRRYAGDMAACTDRWIREWKDGDRLELSRETTRITMSVAGKTLFDAETFTDADAIGEALTVALEWTGENAPSWNAIAHVAARRAGMFLGEKWGQPWLVEGSRRYEYPRHFPGKSGRRLKEAILLLDAQVAKMISDRRANPDAAPDLLTRLLHAKDEDDGTGMTDKQVRDEVLTLFVAGHETTATGLAWALHCLCNHPDIYARVEAEVDALGHEPTFDDLPRLPLTLRVFREALRLYPPVYVYSRQASQATSIDGYDICKNTVVILSPWALHRRADLFPDPERFDPDRFLPEVEQARPKLSWLPFGAGPRVCIGNQFAMMEGQIVLAKLLRHARFEAIGVDTPDPGVTLRPRDNMPMRVRLRGRPEPVVGAGAEARASSAA